MNGVPVVHGHQPRLAGLEKRRSKPVTLPWDTRLAEEPKLGLPMYETNSRFVHSEFLQYRDAQDCQMHTIVQTFCINKTSEVGVSQSSRCVAVTAGASRGANCVRPCWLLPSALAAALAAYPGCSSGAWPGWLLPSWLKQRRLDHGDCDPVNGLSTNRCTTTAATDRFLRFLILNKHCNFPIDLGNLLRSQIGMT